MTRISAKKTRQALLVADAELHPGFPPDTIAFFDADGNPIDLTNPARSDTLPAGGLTGEVPTKVSDTDYDVAWAPVPPSGMIWQGTWDSTKDYHVNDVVQYDDGSGVHTYIFIVDAPAPPPVTPDPPMPNFDGDPIGKYWDPAVTPLAVTLDDSSQRSDVVYNANSPYVAIAFKKVSGGTIQITSAPQDGVYRNLLANFYKLNTAQTGWTYVTQNDDSAGLGHPRITTSQANNWFLFVLTTTDGVDPSTQYGTSLISLGSSNAAVFAPFVFSGGVDFPTDKVVKIA